MSQYAGASAVDRRERNLVDGEFPFTVEDFRKIAAILHADAGISLPDTKATLVYSRLAKRLRALGLENFRRYCSLVSSEDGGDERRRMLSALTTNVTRFFREPHHFEHLSKNVLPELIERAKRGGRVRIWSAGCSTGQEPYSIAMTLLALDPEAGSRDIRILASDIDPFVVAEARDGVYERALVAEIPDAYRSRFLNTQKQDGEIAYSIAPAVRQIVSFRELNLIGEWPMKGKFDVIFCRNVVIYFAEETQVLVWNRFKDMMVPGGRLYIGHSERVIGTADAFVTDGLTTYRRAGARS